MLVDVVPVIMRWFSLALLTLSDAWRACVTIMFTTAAMLFLFFSLLLFPDMHVTYLSLPRVLSISPPVVTPFLSIFLSMHVLCFLLSSALFVLRMRWPSLLVVPIAPRPISGCCSDRQPGRGGAARSALFTIYTGLCTGFRLVSFFFLPFGSVVLLFGVFLFGVLFWYPGAFRLLVVVCCGVPSSG